MPMNCRADLGRLYRFGFYYSSFSLVSIQSIVSADSYVVINADVSPD